MTSSTDGNNSDATYSVDAGELLDGDQRTCNEEWMSQRGVREQLHQRGWSPVNVISGRFFRFAVYNISNCRAGISTGAERSRFLALGTPPSRRRRSASAGRTA